MRNIFYLLLLTFGFGILHSCEESTGITPSETNENPIEIDLSNANWDETVKAVAYDVSKKLNSKAFRKMLKHEVLLRFDGDANILLSSIVNRLQKYLEYESKIEQVARTNDSDLLADLDFSIIKQAAENYPQMQLAVQVNAENWDADYVIPSVVFLDSEYDEITHHFVNGYDNSQNQIQVSILEDPNENYVVVSQNERTIIRDDNSIRLRSTESLVRCFDETAPYSPDNPEPPSFDEYEDCGGTGGGSGGGSSSPQYIGTGHGGQLPSLIATYEGELVQNDNINANIAPIGDINGITLYRGNFVHEKIREMRLDDIGDIEGWPGGAPEIRVHVFEQDEENPLSMLQIFKEVYEPKKRNDIKNEWWDCADAPLHLWDWETTGIRISYGYYEFDPVAFDVEELEILGNILQQILNITGVIPPVGPNGEYGPLNAVVDQSINIGERALNKQNGMSEYIGTVDISIFNSQDYFEHNPGDFKYKTWPDIQ